MTVYVYQQVSTQTRKALPCPSCGKKVRRSRTFTNTINPFNKNSEGRVKEYAEVRADVLAEAVEWETRAEVCTSCQEAPDA